MSAAGIFDCYLLIERVNVLCSDVLDNLTAFFSSRARTRQRPHQLQRSSTVKPAARRNAGLVLFVWMFPLKHGRLENVHTFPFFDFPAFHACIFC